MKWKRVGRDKQKETSETERMTISREHSIEMTKTNCTCVLSSCLKLLQELERKLSGEEVITMEGPSEGDSGEKSLTSIQLNDMANGSGNGETKRKKKLIYFADGSTMEDVDDDDDDTTDNDPGAVEEKISRSAVTEQNSEPPVDPSKMEWPEWIRYQTSKAGSKTLSVLEGMGGSAAYFLGITTPKYQSEIDEYNRMVAKKKSQEEDLVSWSTGPKGQSPQEPVVEDVKSDEKSGEVAVPE